MSLPKLALEYLQYCESTKKSKHTITNYKLDLKKWISYQFGNKEISAGDVGALKLIDLDKFVGSLSDKSASTILRTVATIKSFYKYLHKYELIRDNISINITTPKKEKRNPKYLSVNEITKLINSPETMNIRHPQRDKAILTMFVGTGIRLSELTNIKLSDIKDDMLRVIGKGNKERFVPLSERVQATIKKYLIVRPRCDDDALFITENKSKFNPTALTHLVKKYLKQAGLSEYSTHKLRHTAASEWYENGTDIREIQELLGHASISTTEMYTHSNKDKKSIVNNVRW